MPERGRLGTADFGIGGLLGPAGIHRCRNLRLGCCVGGILETGEYRRLLLNRSLRMSLGGSRGEVREVGEDEGEEGVEEDGVGGWL